MTNFDQAIIDQMLSFGFKHYRIDVDAEKTIYEYKYIPEYLNGDHYTLLIYNYHVKIYSSDHQLNIYDSDNRNKEIIYQISSVSEWQRSAITEQINDIFQAELRMITINNIINE